MAYPPLSASRRPRRRAAVAILIIVALVVGIIALAVRFRTERRDSIDYLVAAKEIADEHAAMASRLADLFSTLDDLDRPDILERLIRLGEESQNLQGLLEPLTVTAAVGEANGFFVVATSSWNRALDGLDDAVVEILDGAEDGRAGRFMLANAFRDLRVGDRSYALFRESLERLDDPELVTNEYPEFGYTAGDRGLLYDADLVTVRLQSTLRFEEHRDVSVRATTDPEPLRSENGLRIIPDSETFSVQAVVTNEGNVAVELITVSIRLVAAGGDAIDERSEIVAVLEPGEATTVLFDDFVLEPSVAYELEIAAQIPDDDVPDNNEWEIIVVRNEP